jgi:predicted NBD/HSP70 family sugar kinase
MSDAHIACVEIGGSGVETVVFAPDGTVVRVDGAARQPGDRLAIATPGLIEGTRVVAASSLGWLDVDPAVELGIGPSAEIVLNDAEAAALGEVALRNGVSDLVYVCVGTGVGAAVVGNGVVTGSNLLGHLTGYSSEPCLCGQTGCLETVAAGWALPDPITADRLEAAAAALADALSREPLATPSLVVLGGGISRRYPALCMHLAEHAPSRHVELSAAPPGFKSAAAWGLRAVLTRSTMPA